MASAWWAWQGIDSVGYLPTSAIQSPLLPWLIQAGWWVLGSNEIWPRVAANLFGLGTLWLMTPISRSLWPDHRDIRRLAPLILAGSGGFLAYAAMTSFMLPLMFAISLLTLALLKLHHRGRWRDWLIAGGAVGLGLLAAGGIALQYMIPIAILLPLTSKTASQARITWRWLAGVAGAIGLGGAIAIAATIVVDGGGRFESWSEWLVVLATSGVGVPARPWYWLPILLPVFLYPWIWWPTLWQAVRRGMDDFARPALRTCGLIIVVALIVAMLNGRNSFLILPMLPPLALMAAWMLSAHAGKPKDFHAAMPGLLALFLCLFFFLLNIVPVAHLDALWHEFRGGPLPVWMGGISLASGIILLLGSYLLTLLTPRGLAARIVQLTLLPLLLVITVNIEFAANLRPYFDLSPVAQRIESLQRNGQPVAVLAPYIGAFDFVGRLQAPPAVLADVEGAIAWARAHKDGVIISQFTGSILHLPAQPLFLGNAESQRTALWPAPVVSESNGLVLSETF
jgi:hypothetical protein